MYLKMGRIWVSSGKKAEYTGQGPEMRMSIFGESKKISLGGAESGISK